MLILGYVSFHTAHRKDGLSQMGCCSSHYRKSSHQNRCQVAKGSLGTFTLLARHVKQPLRVRRCLTEITDVGGWPAPPAVMAGSMSQVPDVCDSMKSVGSVLGWEILYQHPLTATSRQLVLGD